MSTHDRSTPGGFGPASTLAFHSLDSTNAEARRQAEAGEGGPLWITAARQTAARARRGRGWETGTGNLAATLLTITDRPPAEAARLSFVAALAVADLAVAFVPEALVRVKWPNDVLVDGRKVAGILIESGARTYAAGSGGGLWLAIGIGVNLATSPLSPERPATALADHLRADIGDSPTPAAALETLSAAFARWHEAWRTQGFAPIREAWRARAYGLGRPCTVRLERESLEGTAEDLDETGALVLRLPGDAVRLVTAGDVFFDLAPAGAA